MIAQQLRLLGGIAGLALVASPAMAQGTKAVTGTATYRERIALPPEAVFEATLEDVSRSDAPAVVMGRARLEKPGQPPFHFSIPYDPAQIVEGRSYAVRAQVTSGGRLMFATDQSSPALTRGNSSPVMLIMRRAGASSSGGGAGGAAKTLSTLGPLPASFSGELPCADCQGIRYALNLFPDKTFFLRITYIGGDGNSTDDIGRVTLSSDGSMLTLHGGKEPAEHLAVKSGDVLRKLDSQGREINSQLNYDLRRTSAFERIEPRLAMRGMFQYMADAATFTECQTGQRWPVSMEGAYRALEAAYLDLRRQPAEELLISLEGQVASRPNAHGGRPTPTLIVERHMGVWPGETCGAPFATAPLEETYWKLTRIQGKPVILAEKQRESSLVFRSQQSRVTGFGGCNNLTGTYRLNGSELVFSGIAATQMACVEGMDTEAALFDALDKVRTWKITGEHLELYDASGTTLARFEARALK